MERPLVTVLMPVYNGEYYLREAVESILRQTFRDFEFIIIDDGSTDGSASIIKEYQKRDSRIKAFRQENKGLAATLNRGLDAAEGEYIARMDADDVSLPTRIEKQVAFMEASREVGVCGTWVKTIGDENQTIWRYPPDDAVIKCRLLFRSPFAHPSVMIRRRLLSEKAIRYEPCYQPAEDYALWVRLASHTAFANIPQVLLFYRLHQLQASEAHRAEQLRSAKRLRSEQIERLGIQPTGEQLALHQAISEEEMEKRDEFITTADGWLRRLQTANQERGIYPEPAFSIVLGIRWYVVCSLASNSRLSAWYRFLRSPLSISVALHLPKKVFLEGVKRRAPSLVNKG